MSQISNHNECNHNGNHLHRIGNQITFNQITFDNNSDKCHNMVHHHLRLDGVEVADVIIPVAVDGVKITPFEIKTQITCRYLSLTT